MSPDEAEGGVIAFRLSALEGRINTMEQNVERRLDAIQGTIGTLAFVRKDVYESEYRALTEKVEAARTIAMWSLGTTLTVTALVGTLIGILRLIAG